MGTENPPVQTTPVEIVVNPPRGEDRDLLVPVPKDSTLVRYATATVPGDCSEGFSLKSQILSDISLETIVFQFPKSEEEILVSVNGENFKIKNTTAVARFWKKQICENSKDEKTPADREKFQAFGKLLSSIVSDCELNFQDQQWICKVPQQDSRITLQKMENLKKTMIVSWSRQPYILARRASVTRELANVIKNGVRAEKIDKFCRLLQLSLENELPLVMAAQRWKTKVCSDSPIQQKEALLHFALLKASEELDIMKDLFESSSKEGLFSVRIPPHQIPPANADDTSSNQLLVTIVPEEQVLSSLKDQMGSILAKENAQEVVQGTPCWHPVFGTTTKQYHIARSLGLTGRAVATTCTPAGEEIAEQQVVMYVANSLASETEFVIKNGSARVLRLPKGQYTYSIQSLPNDMESFNPQEGEHNKSFPSSRGKISWDSRRPVQVVRQWQ